MRHLCDSGPFSSRLGGDSGLEIAKAWLLLGLPCRGSAKGGTMPRPHSSWRRYSEGEVPVKRRKARLKFA